MKTKKEFTVFEHIDINTPLLLVSPFWSSPKFWICLSIGWGIVQRESDFDETQSKHNFPNYGATLERIYKFNLMLPVSMHVLPGNVFREMSAVHLKLWKKRNIKWKGKYHLVLTDHPMDGRNRAACTLLLTQRWWIWRIYLLMHLLSFFFSHHRPAQKTRRFAVGSAPQVLFP